MNGVHVIMPTPFGPDGALDLASLERLTEFLVSLDVDGLVVLGVLGEAPKLSEAEQQEVVTTTVAAAGGRVPVLASGGAAGTDLAIARSRTMLRAGADGLLVAPPPVQDDSVILTYYERLDSAVECPIVLHDYPVATGIKMSAELVVRIHDALRNDVVIKLEDTPSVTKVTAIRRLGSDMPILGGLGGLFMLEELQRGSNGIMTGFSFPDVLLDVYRAHVAGDSAGASARFFAVTPLLRYEFQPVIGLGIRKEVYRMRGAIDHAQVRHPGVQVDEVTRAELQGLIAQCGLSLGPVPA